MTTQGYAVASVWTFISWMGGLETMFQVKCIETPKLFQTAKRQMDVTDIAPYKDSATGICSICAPALSMRSLFYKWFPVGSSVNVGAHRFGKNLQLPNGAIATITGQHPRHEWFPLYCGEASPVFFFNSGGILREKHAQLWLTLYSFSYSLGCFLVFLSFKLLAFSRSLSSWT